MDDHAALTTLITLAKSRQTRSVDALKAEARAAGMDKAAIDRGLDLWAACDHISFARACAPKDPNPVATGRPS